MRVRALPLARALARRGHAISVILPPWDAPADSGRAWRDAGVAVHCLSLAGISRPRASLRLGLRLWRAVLATQPAIVYCFKPIGYSGLVGWLTRFTPRRPALVFDLDDLEGRAGWAGPASRTPAEAWLREGQERWAMRHADALTTASDFLRRAALGTGMPAGRVHLARNGCASAEPAVGTAAWEAERRLARQSFGIAPAEPVILWGARPDEFPSERLAEIMRRVWSARPAARLLIAGGASAALEGPATELGWLVPADWRAAVQAADIGILPMDDSLLQRARCPAKMPQMLAWGLPLVAHAVGEAPAYVEDGLTGRLVTAGDDAAFADAVLSLLAAGSAPSDYSLRAAARAPALWGWDRQAGLVEGAFAAAEAQRMARLLAG
jgi:glycosyltransferase involved in cell wall biosynthesis